MATGCHLKDGDSWLLRQTSQGVVGEGEARQLVIWEDFLQPGCGGCSLGDPQRIKSPSPVSQEPQPFQRQPLHFLSVPPMPSCLG